jgi:uncharacterized membrane protein YkgB
MRPPAFMLGAVAAFLSILMQWMERLNDRIRALRADDASGADPEQVPLQKLGRRVMLLGQAIYFGVLSALVTSALLIAAFAPALLGVGHGAIVAIMFVVALSLLMTCLVNLALEIRIQLATIGLD